MLHARNEQSSVNFGLTHVDDDSTPLPENALLVFNFIYYVSVPLGVLNERYESAMERDEIDEDNVQNGNLFDESGE